jgi:thioredoxin reductase (NADPH)
MDPGFRRDDDRGARARNENMQDFDLIVVGAGVAGLTAALTAARHGLKTAVIERLGAGGQIVTATEIANFPGFPQGIAGHELGPLLHEQAEAAGAEFMLDTVQELAIDGDHRIVRCAGDELRAGAVVIAAGSTLRSLGIPGEDRLAGKGVSHCASCDGPFFRGQAVCVVGGGDAAVDEALVLAEHAAGVTIFHRGAALRAQQALRDRLAAAGTITVALQTAVDEILGDDSVTGVRLRDIASGTIREEPLGGVFVFVGLEPNTGFLRGTVALDNAGHIATDIMMRTSLDGVFAAGDIRAGSVAHLAASCGDGATAAIAAWRYLRGKA